MPSPGSSWSGTTASDVGDSHYYHNVIMCAVSASAFSLDSWMQSMHFELPGRCKVWRTCSIAARSPPAATMLALDRTGDHRTFSVYRSIISSRLSGCNTVELAAQCMRNAGRVDQRHSSALAPSFLPSARSRKSSRFGTTLDDEQHTKSAVHVPLYPNPSLSLDTINSSDSCSRISSRLPLSSSHQGSTMALLWRRK
ncbi:hypothetical protein BXZ70DRAFT_364254 [Cristinia sonorae]|uniref:Uncharacterized protein n=1 Tax=Cristinia sonorae TaxID=1940300 RepID=A0A8K0XMU5_9AGAR|nr:hypothetical protein BXZ70DRAFT_364254 [Cristinia sonorae]